MAGVLGFMAVALGVAWACTVQAGIVSLSPDNPEPGQTITVTGDEYYANAQIQLRWGGDAGPVIGEATADEAGTFTAEGTVPASAEPGEHLLVAKDAGVSTGGRASIMVNVAGERPEPTPEPQPDTAEEPEPAQEPSNSEPEPAQEPTTEAPAPESAEGDRQQVGGERQQIEGDRQQIGGERQQVGASQPPADESAAQPAPAPAEAAPAQPAPAEPEPAEATPAQPAPAEATPTEPEPSEATPAEPEPSDQSAADDTSVETSGPVSLGPDQVNRGSASEPEAAASEETPSTRSATGDLWSGVAPSDAPSLTPGSGYDVAADADQSGPGQLAVGLALLGAGLTVLLVGAGVPALRRRVPARARSSRSS